MCEGREKLKSDSIQSRPGLHFAFGAFLLTFLFGCGVLKASPSQSFKIYIEESGVYSLSYEELFDAGLAGKSYELKEISLWNRDQPVAFWVDGGETSGFGSGQQIVFVGERLRGEYSYLDEFSAYNTYVLRFGEGEGRRARTLESPGDPHSEASGLQVRHHMEEDIVMVRFHEKPKQPEERWYWSRMAVTDQKPFSLRLKLDHLKVETVDAADLSRVDAVGPGATAVKKHLEEIYSSQRSVENIRLRMAFRGWSQVRKKAKEMADHRILVRADGQQIAVLEWNGQEMHLEDVEVPGDLALDGNLKIELEVDRRKEAESGDLFVDVVLFDWLELSYARNDDFKSGQSRFEIAGKESGEESPLRLKLPSRDGGWLYSSPDTRMKLSHGENELLLPNHDAKALFVVVGKGTRPPVRLVIDRPSQLKVRNRQADYLIVTHRSLMDSVAPLAEFHRKQGLTVALIDVEDIYDEFHWGVPNPASLRDFFSWAYHNWEKPGPRFVLLAGDASWDWKNTTVSDANYADWTYRPGEVWKFVKNGSTPYGEDASVNHRNLVPTWGFRSHEGHAASDNWLVCVDGDDYYPDLAVGRIPVATPEEMKAVVAKTLRYASKAQEGDWRKRILFITNESKGFQHSSDRSAEEFESRGFEIEKVYPDAAETANDQHTKRLLDIFDQGVLMTQFLGHGGRYIWRTGPPDLKKNHDLFTLEDLDQLKNNGKLSFIISLTCYSAPFDHPTADSIGEKFLRMPDKGAIGVFAASWRNSPSSMMGRIVMEELTTPGESIGEAIMKAKAQLHNEILIQTYNLLGDPAIHLAAPEDVRN